MTSQVSVTKNRAIVLNVLHLRLHSICLVCQALEVIKRALADDNVKVGHRLTIYQRLEKLRKSQATKQLTADLDNLKHDEIIPAPSVRFSTMQTFQFLHILFQEC